MNTRNGRGFTLIEMMVVLLIAAMVLGAGVPALQSMVRRQRVVSAVNDFVHAAHLTRAAAMRQGGDAVMLPLVRGDWNSGWNVRVNGQLVMTRPALAGAITVTFNPGGERLTFRADGQPAGFSTWHFFDGPVRRHIVMSMLGRIRICTPNGAAAC